MIKDIGTEDQQNSLFLQVEILRVLLINAQYNDSIRRFAGIRRPSKLRRKIMREICELHAKQAKLNAE